jgi:hypothetical protein
VPHAPAAPERAAVLVIRAWLHGDPPTLAARIVSTLDVARPERSTRAVTGPDGVSRAVAEWLEELLSSG